MRHEPPGVVGQVISLFVVVRHLEVVIDKQAVRDEQVVRLVSTGGSCCLEWTATEATNASAHATRGATRASKRNRRGRRLM